MPCCNWDTLTANVCQAIENGLLTNTNYAKWGLSRGEYLLLLAQCGTTAALEDIGDQIDIVIGLLQDIDANTDGLEAQLADILLELQDVNVNLGDVITELQAILVAVQNIDDNTDGIEAQLATVISLLTAIDTNTDGLEACCAAGNALLTTIDATLTSLLNNQGNPAVHGNHTITTGTEAGAPAAGPYYSWVVVRTNAAGTLTVDGIPLVNLGDSTAEEAQPGFQLPNPVISAAGGATYAWRAKT